jgi:hypothetical protein
MDLGNLKYMVFPLYFAMLYLTSYNQYQYITMPLIAFMNILIILSVLFGTTEPSNAVILLMNIALFGLAFYIFANSTITWLITAAIIGATAIGTNAPNMVFNKNISIISMLILSIAIIMGAISTSNVQVQSSKTESKPLPMPRSYQTKFNEIKGAMLSCLIITLAVVGLNNSFVSAIEMKPTPDTATSSILDNAYSIFKLPISLALTLLTMVKSIFMFVFNIIGTGAKWIAYGLNYILSLTVGRFVSMPDTSSIGSTILQYITSFFDTIVRFVLSLLSIVLGTISTVFQLITRSSSDKPDTPDTQQPKTLSQLLTLAAVAGLSSINLKIAISQFYNGFELLRIPSLLVHK